MTSHGQQEVPCLLASLDVLFDLYKLLKAPNKPSYRIPNVKWRKMCVVAKGNLEVEAASLL